MTSASLTNYDLHSHSNCSDGSLSPVELVQAAQAGGVTHLAITDHDTLDALPEANSAAATCGLTLINGIEFSCQWQKRGVHVVGLAFDAQHPAIVAGAKHMLAIRQERALQIAEKLNKLGIGNALAGAQKAANGGMIGRPHFAQFLVESGVVKNFNQAFKRYLGTGKAGDVKHQWPEMAEVAQWIKDADGVAVLAHPLKYSLTRTKLKQLFQDFAGSGGQAVEVISGNDQTAQQTRDLAKLINQQGFYGSLGSDFHSPGMAWQALGRAGPLPDDVEPVWQLWS